MEQHARFFFVLTMFVLVAFTGCSPTSHISVKPSSGSLGERAQSATGKVHVYPVIKGPGIVPSAKEPEYTDISSGHRSAYVTKDDVTAIVNKVSVDAIREAGYTVSEGKDIPQDASLAVSITLKNMVAEYKRNSISKKVIVDALEGDFGKREDSIFAQTFGNTATGVIITEVKFINPKTSEIHEHLVSGADNTMGFGTNDGSVETALGYAFTKYKQNLIKALRAFQRAYGN